MRECAKSRGKVSVEAKDAVDEEEEEEEDEEEEEEEEGEVVVVVGLFKEWLIGLFL